MRAADIRSVSEVSAKLRAVTAQPATTLGGRLMDSVAPITGRMPGLYRASDRVELREVLDLTVTIDHNVVDGAPAARFGADLRHLLERYAEWAK